MNKDGYRETKGKSRGNNRAEANSIRKHKAQIGKRSALTKLVDIIVIGLLSTICLGEDFVDMETFGKKKIEWLKTFLELPNGIPDSDTFRRMFERLNPDELHKCLNEWLMSAQLSPKGKTINIDGKTIR